MSSELFWYKLTSSQFKLELGPRGLRGLVLSPGTWSLEAWILDEMAFMIIHAFFRRLQRDITFHEPLLFFCAIFNFCPDATHEHLRTWIQAYKLQMTLRVLYSYLHICTFAQTHTHTQNCLSNCEVGMHLTCKNSSLNLIGQKSRSFVQRLVSNAPRRNCKRLKLTLPFLVANCSQRIQIIQIATTIQISHMHRLQKKTPCRF